MDIDSPFKVIFESENIKYVELNNVLIYDYLEMMNDRDIRKFISHEEFEEISAAKELDWIEENKSGDTLIFSMMDKSSKGFIGNIEVDKNGKLGIVMIRHMQNKHFGTEAIKSIIKYCLDNDYVKKFKVNVYSINEKAIHVYEKIGFKKAGVGKTDQDILMVYEESDG